MSPDRGRVIIAGGSIAGLFAGALLCRQGFAVDVFERSGEALASRGAGIVSHPELFAALEQAGADVDDSLGVEVVGRIVLGTGRRGYRRTSRCRRSCCPGTGSIACSARSFRMAHYHAGRAVEGFEQNGDGVAVWLADGGSEHAEWLIGADGIRSAVRRRLLPDLEPAYAGYVAWRGLIPENAISAEARAVLGERLMFCLPAGEQMLGYPLSGAEEASRSGRRRYNVVWYRPGRRGLAALIGRDGRRYELSIPPGPGRSPGAVAALRVDAEALLAACCAEVVQLIRPPFIQAIYDLESPRLLFDRAILIGDAAFVARPHAGMGVTKAALDAVTLAEAFAAPERAAALGAWESRRRRYGQAVVERARRLGAYLATPAATAEAWASTLKEVAATLLTETAISGWLRA